MKTFKFMVVLVALTLSACASNAKKAEEKKKVDGEGTSLGLPVILGTDPTTSWEYEYEEGKKMAFLQAELEYSTSQATDPDTYTASIKSGSFVVFTPKAGAKKGKNPESDGEISNSEISGLALRIEKSNGEALLEKGMLVVDQTLVLANNDSDSSVDLKAGEIVQLGLQEGNNEMGKGIAMIGPASVGKEEGLVIAKEGKISFEVKINVSSEGTIVPNQIACKIGVGQSGKDVLVIHNLHPGKNEPSLSAEQLALLPAGDYVGKLTCDLRVDKPSDELKFSLGANDPISVLARVQTQTAIKVKIAKEEKKEEPSK